LLVVRREWIKAYFHARKAVAITRKAVQADPEYYDAYLGLGMYDYYSDLYPRLVGVLAHLVLGGDRLRGIATLRKVAEKGKFSRSIAKILLVEIYTEDPFGAKDPKEAVRIVEELRAEYPTSAMMHSSELVAWYSAQRYQDMVAGAGDYLRLVREGKYNPIEAAKGAVILGTAQWALGQKKAALDSFHLAAQIRLGGRLSRWAVWALIRSGQLRDTMGLREEALADYRAALDAPDEWHLRSLAKDGIAKPFSEQAPGEILPP
jgi:tetratricopeptide (TPR) repeat protein